MSANSSTWLARAAIAICRPLVRLVYRLEVKGLENLPPDGGIIVAANHLSYVDAVLLVTASPRPLRAIAWGGLQRHFILRAVFRIFGVLPVTSDNARESLREAVEVLKAGGAVLIFPEGKISRTGELQHFSGGFNMLARHAEAPVVPVHLQGLWGSIFSFEGGRFFWKWPRHLPFPVAIHFGPPLPADQASAQNLHDAVKKLAEQYPEPVNAPLRNAGPKPALAPSPPFFPNQAPPPASRQPGQPLVDLDEAAFRKRPELAEHLGARLVRALRRQARHKVVVDCMGDPPQSMSGAKLLAVSLALAARIRRQVPESRVGIVLPPSLGGFIANYAVMLAGKTPVNLNFTIGKAALEASIRKAGVRTTLSSNLFREKITARLPDLPWSEDVRDLREEITELRGVVIGAWWFAAKFLPAGLLMRLGRVPREGGDREAALLFTSGSSGEPKGVVLTHRNILGNGAQIDASGILPSGETVLGNLPIFHSFGFTIILWYAIQHGIRVVTVPSPLDTRKCIDAITTEQVTALLGTPTFFRAYLKRAEPAEMASLRFVIAGAEKTPEGFHDEWEKRFGGQYCEGYGLTETSPVVAVNLPCEPGESEEASRKKKRRGSVGRLFPGHAARITDPDTDAERGFNEAGMLLLRGVNIFPGYLDQPEATTAAFKDGWFVTGDLAKIDEDGFIYIEGRLSRFSKIGGEMVPHGTVENAVIEAFGLKGSEHPAVAVSARPDAAKGEALVILTTVDLNPDQVREKLTAAGLANLWIPRIIKKVDAIPLLGTGKLDLRGLKELAKEN